MLVLVLVVSIFALCATYIYTDGCYRISRDISKCQEELLPESLFSASRGSLGMGGTPWTSVYVLFAIALILSAVGMLLVIVVH